MGKEPTGSLRKGCLNFTELTSVAIALISPTMTAALIVPLMYSSAGNASWLAYLFGTVMLLFVALNLNQFARRSSSAGSMFAYTVMGLGPAAGGISGWCLVWAYLFIGTAGMTGFTIFANTLFGMMGFQLPNIVIFAACAAVIWFLAYKDIRLSSILMLVLEGASVGLILILCWVVLFKHNFTVDTAQLKLSGASFSGISLGVVTAIFSLVGFECATAFGDEAKNPLKTIPRAVIVSLLLTGLFFVIVAYTEVLGFAGYKVTLDKVDAPLNVLAELVSMPWLKAPVSIGAMVSFFSLALSCLNSGARILYPMARHGVFPAAIGNAHETNETPHVAVTVMAALIFLVPTSMLLVFRLQILDAFNDAGTFGAFGFLGAYFLISVAAPAYLSKAGMLRGRDTALAIASVTLLLVPLVGSVYPVPSWPVNIFPYIFGTYLIIGIAWIFSVHKRTPGYSADVKRRVYNDHGQLVNAEVSAMTPQQQGELRNLRDTQEGDAMEMNHEFIGSLMSVWRYPVKSMLGEELKSARVTERGLLGDRAYALLDRETGKVASAKNPRKWPSLFKFKATLMESLDARERIPPVMITMSDGTSVNSEQHNVDRVLSSALDRDVSLRSQAPETPKLEEYWPDLENMAHRETVTEESMPPDGFFDGAVVHLLTTATLDRLRSLYPDGSFLAERFRPNLLVVPASSKTGFVENSWIGRTIAIGEQVRLLITANTGRCVMTTLAQGNLPKDIDILRTAVEANQANVGVYASVTRGGVIRRSDVVAIE